MECLLALGAFRRFEPLSYPLPRFRWHVSLVWAHLVNSPNPKRQLVRSTSGLNDPKSMCIAGLLCLCGVGSKVYGAGLLFVCSYCSIAAAVSADHHDDVYDSLSLSLSISTPKSSDRAACCFKSLKPWAPSISNPLNPAYMLGCVSLLESRGFRFARM